MIEDTLPELLQTIEAELGYAAMLKFAHEFGGQRILIPKNPGPDSKLTQRLGLELAREICRVVGHGNLTVPLGPTANWQRFRIAIQQQLKEGKSANEIARTLHCHEMTARRHRRKLKLPKSDPRQTDIFGEPES